MPRVGVCIAGILAVWMVFASPAAAAPPTSRDEFTADVAARLRQAVPKLHFTVTGPLTIDVAGVAGGDHTAYLDTLYSACVRNPADCEDFVRRHIAEMATFYTDIAEPTGPGALRVVVRSTDYVSRAQHTGGGVVAKPIAGDLWAVGALDRPSVIELLTPKSLTTMSLATDAAFARAEANMQAAMVVDLKSAIGRRRDGIIVLVGDTYESSLLAFHDLWRPLTNGLRGQLLVAAPSTDVVVFCDGGGRGAIEAMMQTIALLSKQGERPVSNQILAWTEHSWTPVADTHP